MTNLRFRYAEKAKKSRTTLHLPQDDVRCCRIEKTRMDGVPNLMKSRFSFLHIQQVDTCAGCLSEKEWRNKEIRCSRKLILLSASIIDGIAEFFYCFDLCNLIKTIKAREITNIIVYESIRFMLALIKNMAEASLLKPRLPNHFPKKHWLNDIAV